MVSILDYLFEVQQEEKEKRTLEMFMKKNPRGFFRQRDGRGLGRGMKGGNRVGKNVKPCPDGGPGFGDGQGQGAGKNR